MSKPRIDASTDSCGKAINEIAINVTDSANTTVFSLDRNTPISSLEGELTVQVWKEVIKYEKSGDLFMG
jgi:hypothetical protein